MPPDIKATNADIEATAADTPATHPAILAIATDKPAMTAATVAISPAFIAMTIIWFGLREVRLCTIRRFIGGQRFRAVSPSAQ